MALLLSDGELARLQPAERMTGRYPVPTRMVSNGEYTPLRQTPWQRDVEHRLERKAATMAERMNQSSQYVLSSPLGMAAAFASMNEVYGRHFDVGEGEVTDPDSADARRSALAGQFVFDDQVHFLREDADPEVFKVLVDMVELGADMFNLKLAGRAPSMTHLQFANFIREIYVDSDTKVALLSAAPADDPAGWFLTNNQMADARTVVNEAAGSRRLLTHAVFTPHHPGWEEEIDRVHAEIRPDGWKCYPIGEPFQPSRMRWRLDDEKLVYPGFEKMLKAGVRNICIHKGLLPANAEETMPGAEAFARVDDVARAARDWPDLNFIVYHAGYRTIPAPTTEEVERYERTGRIDWVSELAEMRSRDGLNNVYADIGASFAFTCMTNPRICAGLLGILIQGLGADHVFWGTDSVWYGSPQWQIEAFRRIEIPDDLQKRFGYAPLGDATGPIKAGILGINAAPFYGLDPADYAAGPDMPPDRIDLLRQAYEERGMQRTNLSYGYVAP